MRALSLFLCPAQLLKCGCKLSSGFERFGLGATSALSEVQELGFGNLFEIVSNSDSTAESLCASYSYHMDYLTLLIPVHDGVWVPWSWCHYDVMRIGLDRFTAIWIVGCVFRRRFIGRGLLWICWCFERFRWVFQLRPLDHAGSSRIRDECFGSDLLQHQIEVFFLATHCGGRRCALPPASPHPLLLCNLCPLVPTPLPFACSISINDFFFLCASFFVLLAWYIFHNRRPLVLTPIPFAFGISINDLGSYVLLSLYFFLGTHCGGRRCASLVPSCHEHRLFELNLFFLMETIFYVRLAWYALRGEALRPPPCNPPPAFIV